MKMIQIIKFVIIIIVIKLINLLIMVNHKILIKYSIIVSFILNTYSKELKTLNFLEDNVLSSLDNYSTLPGIKCFWFEPNSMNVFDLKKLKRPIKQN
jgi:hypothetical protein